MNKNILLMALIFLIGCNHSLKYKIHNYCSESSECILKLKDITNFKWDKLYVFNDLDNKIIDSIIGTHYNPQNFPFGSLKYIFLYKNQIVYADEVEETVSKPPKDKDYIIYQPRVACYLVFTPDNSVFWLYREEPSGFVMLYFKPIKDHQFYFGNCDPISKLISSDSLSVPSPDSLWKYE